MDRRSSNMLIKMKLLRKPSWELISRLTHPSAIDSSGYFVLHHLFSDHVSVLKELHLVNCSADFMP